MFRLLDLRFRVFYHGCGARKHPTHSIDTGSTKSNNKFKMYCGSSGRFRFLREYNLQTNVQSCSGTASMNSILCHHCSLLPWRVTADMIKWGDDRHSDPGHTTSSKDRHSDPGCPAQGPITQFSSISVPKRCDPPTPTHCKLH